MIGCRLDVGRLPGIFERKFLCSSSVSRFFVKVMDGWMDGWMLDLSDTRLVEALTPITSNPPYYGLYKGETI